MLENLIFALNSTIPLFLLIAVGFALRKLKILNENYVEVASDLNFKVTLPVLLFTDLADTDFRETFDLKFLIFCAVVTSISFWGIWILAKIFMKDRSQIGEFVQASYRSSAAILGIALIVSMYGSTGMAGMMMIGAVPLYNIYAVLVLQAESPDKSQKKHGAGKLLLGVITNPIILGILAGFLFSLAGITLPTFLDKTLDYIGRVATTLALITVGADFDFKSARSCLGASVLASAIKIAILPAVFLPVAALMGFRTEMLIAIMVMLGSPTTVSCYIMARRYGHAGTLTANAVAMTTLFSAVTLTVEIMILRTLGLV